MASGKKVGWRVERFIVSSRLSKDEQGAALESYRVLCANRATHSVKKTSKKKPATRTRVTKKTSAGKVQSPAAAATAARKVKKRPAKKSMPKKTSARVVSLSVGAAPSFPSPKAAFLRWRRLRSLTDGSTVDIFGYSGFPPDTGPWVGYARNNLLIVPCVHCGQVGVFAGESWEHECPGQYQGVKLPCGAAHACKGQPSMSYHGVTCWLVSGWVEISMA